MKKLIALLLTAMLAVSMTACGTQTASGKATAKPSSSADGSWDYIKNKGELIVGLDDTFAPMGFHDESGALVGFDIDLANALGEELGIKIKFQPIDWDAKELELKNKNIDVIWNGMSKTPERIETMNLSKPYLNNVIAVMTKKDSGISKKDALKDKKVGTQADSSALEVIKKDSLYADLNVTEYPAYDEALLDLGAGRVDAVIIDEVMGSYMNSKLAKDAQYVFTEDNFGDDMYVIGMRKGDDELTKKIDEGLDKLKASEKGIEISKKWFASDILVK